jgi:hypothetical protein
VLAPFLNEPKGRPRNDWIWKSARMNPEQAGNDERMQVGSNVLARTRRSLSRRPVSWLLPPRSFVATLAMSSKG